MSRIEPIQNPDRINELREIGRRVFQLNRSSQNVFKPEIEACLIFHPPENDSVEADYLTEKQYEAIVAAAKHVGDTGFVLCDDLSGLMHGTKRRRFTTPPGSDGPVWEDCTEPAEWWCEFPEYEAYRATGHVCILDTAIYSINAHWGVYTQYEWWHLVGGSVDFIRHVDNLYSGWRNNLITLVDDWPHDKMKRGLETVDLLIETLPYWRKYPGDDWVETFTAKLDQKLTGGL